MKRVLFLLLSIAYGLTFSTLSYADETVTVTATSSDISENLDLKTVATLFGQSKDLEQFEQMLNNPDSAFSNLDLNGDGEVDYLRVIETADNNRHLVVIQAVLAKDIYQDVASIFVEKDEDTQSVTVQVIGDEYIYGVNYIIEPVYIHRPLIYDWFWGTSWVCWHSPYYWGYYPHWWRPYYCVDPFIYWDHCYWHHYHYPICSYRTAHHPHHHFRPMYHQVGRQDFATRHPERSFATRNASRNITNARSIEQSRRESMRQANTVNTSRTRVSAQSGSSRQSMTGMRQEATMNRTFGSSNVRSASASSTVTRTATTSTATRTATASTATRTATTRTNASAAPARSTNTTVRTTATSPSRSTAPSVSRSTSTPARSSSTSSSMRSSSSSTMRSSSAGSSMRSSSASSSMRSSSGSSSSRTGSYGGSRTR